MNRTWKMGVKSQLRKLNGSEGDAAARASGTGVAFGVGEVAGKPLAPDEAVAATLADGPELGFDEPTLPHATTARAISTAKSPTAIQRARDMDRDRREFTLANWVVATTTPRVTASDSTHSHPTPSKQAVFGDRLFGVDRTGRLVATD
jgi:hypothetical protein